MMGNSSQRGVGNRRFKGEGVRGQAPGAAPGLLRRTRRRPVLSVKPQVTVAERIGVSSWSCMMNFACNSHISGLFDRPVALAPLLDEIPVAIALLDPNRRIVFVNRALEALTGFAYPDPAGIPCAQVMRSDICLQRCPAARLDDPLDPLCLEGDILNRDRQKIPVRVTFAPIRDVHGCLIGFLETLEDVRLLRELDGKIGSAYGFGKLIGRSPEMERIFRILPVIAQSDSSVLITGETGTGKDFVAEAIHQSSQRAKGPFVKVNCGALPETLLESELFGHQKGAFTGAMENKPGRFRLAHNGSLYLTEIGDLPLSLQVKLLTFLDDKVVYPLGSTKGFHVNVRVIAATHRNLEQMVQAGDFREDLLFRLNVVRQHLPPLRERGDDPRLLLDHFLNKLSSQFKKPIKGFSPKSLRILQGYSYPGNVRELRNIVEYAVNFCQEDQIQPRHLPAYLTQAKHAPPPAERAATGVGAVSTLLLNGKEADLNWQDLERKMIMEALLKAKGRRSQAARILGWGRSTLWRKMKHYGLAS
ncbi:sigma-54 interaction domain-containing protein [Desulfoferrobacter suflitae]|uniref:sigma-54 interaction domain-containing protein n=1 Tax=Desulfoferrobacter suflitae TaxID=2865782 RepID=UPI002164151D|nr:sigma 54-interacting transcriptional regulator [Desulfoferrobacter suflitae]MCK8601586.1 sigma 54-interacting transcriptional regulator [Desulfoferrobacter suflitae]